MTNNSMNSFLKENNYIWSSNLTGHYVYGPKGKALKNKLEEFLRKEFKDFTEIETPLIYEKDVWLKSGHWDKFQDPVIFTKSKKCHRIDHLLEENFPTFDVELTNNNWTIIKKKLMEIEQLVIEHKKEELGPKTRLLKDDPLVYTDDIQFKDLMMKTASGSHECALRPETATATYNSFNLLESYLKKQYPLKFYQIGKSFRNEANPRNNIIRTREFYQAEFHIAVYPNDKDKEDTFVQLQGDFMINITDDKENTKFKSVKFSDIQVPSLYASLLYRAYKLVQSLNIPNDKIRFRRHSKSERAFYALDAWDIEIFLKESGLGWTEIIGIHDRGNYDLTTIGCIKKKNKNGTPHILELAIGLDRLLYSVLDSVYNELDPNKGKSMLKIPYSLSPIQVSVLPLFRKDELPEYALKIYNYLNKFVCANYDCSGSIGKRYLKNAQNGVPFCVTIDHQTLEDNTMTLRDRDTENQIRMTKENIILKILGV